MVLARTVSAVVRGAKKKSASSEGSVLQNLQIVTIASPSNKLNLTYSNPRTAIAHRNSLDDGRSCSKQAQVVELCTAVSVSGQRDPVASSASNVRGPSPSGTSTLHQQKHNPRPAASLHTSLHWHPSLVLINRATSSLPPSRGPALLRTTDTRRSSAAAYTTGAGL